MLYTATTISRMAGGLVLALCLAVAGCQCANKADQEKINSFGGMWISRGEGRIATCDVQWLWFPPGRQINDDDFAAMLPAIKKLNPAVLQLSGQEQISDRSIGNVNQIECLKILYIGKTAITAVGRSRLRAGIEIAKGEGYSSVTAPHSAAPLPADQERMVTFDWDYQLKRLSGGKEDIDANTLIKLRARVEKTTAPIFDVGAVGGRNDRTAVFSLLNDQHIPRHPQASKVTLITTGAGLTSRFLVEGEIYTIIFTADGRLYDVVDGQGRSGQNDKEKW